ncbi:hypothetical protein [Pseudodesulfovibrio senegalensis]|jgi:hypothetical protein|uniref:Uncharacterized protein n=1 Tax=Pseudodesulfovibrio senegalensis TaxID=1721087 RepID=A0A6N6N592_9BACT|nr:hypothetical protein [Pseudodesulfovibrio senegalensis]KAB1443053.1 hypothetical protein F8A88_01965 [Pseudodesulfovibrio senegalensis]
MSKTTRNFIRHFWVSLGATAYLSFAVMLLYQYLAIVNDLPGAFLSVLHEANGDWWLDADWSHPVFLGWLGCVLLFAAGYGLVRRKDNREYREPDIQSQPGF